MSLQPYQDNEEYKKNRNRSIFYGIIASICSVPLGFLILLIVFYNVSCGGGSCDGSTFDYCTPQTAPTLFLVLLAWFAVVIGLTIAAIHFGLKAKEYK